MGPHVVDPKQPHPLHHGEEVGGHGAVDPLGRVLHPGKLPDGALAGKPHQDRVAQGHDLVQAAEEGEVVLQELPEAEPRVQDHLGHPCA